MILCWIPCPTLYRKCILPKPPGYDPESAGYDTESAPGTSSSIRRYRESWLPMKNTSAKVALIKKNNFMVLMCKRHALYFDICSFSNPVRIRFPDNSKWCIWFVSCVILYFKLIGISRLVIFSSRMPRDSLSCV